MVRFKIFFQFHNKCKVKIVNCFQTNYKDSIMILITIVVLHSNIWAVKETQIDLKQDKIAKTNVSEVSETE